MRKRSFLFVHVTKVSAVESNKNKGPSAIKGKAFFFMTSDVIYSHIDDMIFINMSKYKPKKLLFNYLEKAVLSFPNCLLW